MSFIFRSLEEQYDNLKHKGKSFRSEIADLQAILVDLQRQLVASDEKWKIVEQQHRAKVKAKQVELKAMKKNKKWLSRTSNENDVVIDSLNREMEQIRINKEGLVKQLEELDAEYPAVHDKMVKAVESLHMKFSKIFDTYEEAIRNIHIVRLG